ncbi:MAG: winged helix-turn-helix transcriptional regulator [Candidatus Jordarchaeales archaeon]
MSDYDSLLHSTALKFVAEMNDFKDKLRKNLRGFFDRFSRGVLDSGTETFGKTDISKVLLRLESLVDELVSNMADKTIITALKHMQLLLGEVKNVRKLDYAAEELFRAVKDQAEYYSLLQRTKKLEGIMESLKKAVKEHETYLKNLLSRDEKYRVLAALSEVGGGSYAELAEKLGISRTKLKRYVKELEEAGLIEVERSKSSYYVKVKNVPWRLSLNLEENNS